jgi:hypothetical protein
MSDDQSYRRLAAELSEIAHRAASTITADTVRHASASRPWALAHRVGAARAAIVVFVAAAVTAGIVVGVTRSGTPPMPARPKALAWSELRPQQVPPALDSAASAYDAATHQLLLFGGEEVGGAGQDTTWEWTGASWRQLHPLTSPPLLIGASMAYDPTTGLVVLFGGVGDYALAPAQTWTWNGTTWGRLHPLASPPARAYAAMAFDAVSGQLLLFGGYNSQEAPLADTWDWTGRTWQRLADVGPGPLFGAAMAYDPATRQVLLFGGSSRRFAPSVSGTTWSWSGSAWHALTPAESPPARSQSSLAYDALVGEVVLFGGVGRQSLAARQPHVLDDTWKWLGGTWEKVDATPRPLGRAAAAMAYDPATGQVVLFGGADESLAPLDDTWSLAPS